MEKMVCLKEETGILPRSFYAQDPAAVARGLLGRVLVRRTKEGRLEGRVVETEAYYGRDDPASRAYRGKKSYNELMWGEPGKAFIYMVHGNWLFNVITGKRGEPSGVLIRAVEPLVGLEAMKKWRGVEEVTDLTSGPGKLTKAMLITKKQNGIDVTDPKSEIMIGGKVEKGIEIESSHRIGVSQDLPRKLRFYVKNNKFVSK